ncbi:MAG: anion permease [Synergistaceae bacterium]|jgi:DASS family divalent anion:Na+ symporter|nr:anion permease [Synergistaceae bacterium]
MDNDEMTRKMWTRFFAFEALALAAGVAIGLAPPPDGLGVDAMRILGLLAWAIVNWVSRSAPDFAVALVMCCGWVALRVVPFNVAFASFAGTTPWLLTGALGVSAAVAKSGLLSRMALHAMALCSPTFRGQTLAMLLAGTLLGAFIPSTSAKIAIAGAMSTDIGEKLGFRDRSRGIVGMWAAMYTGFSLTAPMFLSSSFFGYMILALLPPDVQSRFTFGFWALCMIPWAATVLVGSYIAVITIYRPEEEASIPKRQISDMIALMGPMKRDEWITLGVLLLCIFFWVFERRFGIPAAATAVVGMSLLISLNVITVADYNSRIAWDLVTFVGGAMGLASVLGEVGVDVWIGSRLGPLMAGLTGSAYSFVTAVFVSVVLARFVIVDHMTCFTLYIVILTPVCIGAGINPWIAAICCYAAVQQWFVKYQNYNFLGGFASAGGEERIGFGGTVKYCLAFNVISLAGVLVSVPYWRFLGLIP